MVRLAKISICYVLFFVLLAACNDRQDKIGWEPEVAVPLAQLTVDFNQKIPVAQYARDGFSLVGTEAVKNQILYTAITKGLDDSIKRRLPPYLQTDVDNFVSCVNNRQSITPFTANSLLSDLFDSFEENGSITAANNFTYYVLKGLPNEFARAVDSLCNIPIDISQDLNLNMSTLTDKADQLQKLTFLLTVNTRLKINAQMQVYLRDSMNLPYDSLFVGQEGKMPFENVVGDMHKQRVVRSYPTPAESQKALQMQTVALCIKSDSLCLDTSLLWLKDLHNRKIHASVGIMFKANLDDMIEE